MKRLLRCHRSMPWCRKFAGYRAGLGGVLRGAFRGATCAGPSESPLA